MRRGMRLRTVVAQFRDSENAQRNLEDCANSQTARNIYNQLDLVYSLCIWASEMQLTALLATVSSYIHTQMLHSC